MFAFGSDPLFFVKSDEILDIDLGYEVGNVGEEEDQKQNWNNIFHAKNSTS